MNDPARSGAATSSEDDASLLLSIANPDTRIIDRAGSLWIASGPPGVDFDALGRGDPSDDTTAAELCRRHGDVTILTVRAGGPGPVIDAWRGATSSHEIFYCTGRRTIVADHFRNVVARMPIAERGTDLDALCDHFLFRTVPGTSTLCGQVKRVGRGQFLRLAAGTGRIRSHQFDQLNPRPRRASLNVYLDRIDEALTEVLAPVHDGHPMVNLFSGGVDSTLVQSYLGTDIPACTFTLPHYAEAFESTYARQAAGLLGVDVREQEVTLIDYLEQLERLIGATGRPPPHLQLAFYQPLFELGLGRYVIGDQADAVFGVDLRRAILAAPFRSVTGLRVIDLAAMAVSGHRARRLRQLRRTGHQLRQAPWSLEGYAAMFGIYTDLADLTALFGETLVRQRRQARLDTLGDVFRPSAHQSHWVQHIESAQMIDLLCEEIMPCFQQLALASGNTVLSPFVNRRLVDAALSIPASERYRRGLEGKYLPKLLLKRRLPGYPTRQRKGYSHVSFPALYKNGALAPVWQHYPAPDLFVPSESQRLLAEPTQLTWKAITLAIWQHQIQRNPDLQPVPASRTRTFA